MPSSNRTAIADLLRAALRTSGLSQAALAEEVGVSQQTVSKWLSAETQPRPKILPALADALSLEVTDLSSALVAGPPEPPSLDHLLEMRFLALERHMRQLGPDQVTLLEAYVRGLNDATR